MRLFTVGEIFVFLLCCKTLHWKGFLPLWGPSRIVHEPIRLQPSLRLRVEIAMPLNLDFAKNLRFDDESPELELVERGEKFATLDDARLEEQLENFKGHLKKLNLKDPRKLELHIKALESEKLNRSKKVPELGSKVMTRSSNLSEGSRESRLHAVQIGDREETLLKIGNSKITVEAKGISPSAFYEEIHVLNESKKRQQPYNLRKFSTAPCVELGKDMRRTGANGQANPTHREPVHIEDDLSAVPKERNRKKRRQELERTGGTLDSALVLFSSDEEDSQGKACRTPLSKGLEHLHIRSSQSKKTEQQGCNSAKIAYPSREDPDAVEVLFSDLQQLKSMDFLNDVIIDFYIKHIQETRCANSELKQNIFFFNTFFFKKLTDAVALERRKKGTDAFGKVRKWTKGLDIFQKSFLFVPVNDQFHWSLAVICLQSEGLQKVPKAYILHLDSMRYGHNTDALIEILKRYLQAEWNYKLDYLEGPLSRDSLLLLDVQGKRVRVPLQQNEFDCGLFLLHYIELFVEKLPLLFCYDNIDQMFGLDWFIPAEASNLRMTIKRLIESLFVKEGIGRRSSS